MMSELTQHRFDILASIYALPCTIEELGQRDFCKNLPLWYVQTVLTSLERRGYIVELKSGIYKAVKTKARPILNYYGYEVD